MSNKSRVAPNLLFAGISAGLLFLYLALTNPANLRLVLLLPPFVLLLIFFYNLITIIITLLLRNQIGKALQRTIVRAIAVEFTLLLVLASIAQLTSKDALLLTIFVISVAWYGYRARRTTH